MKVTLEQFQNILKTLPISYYAGKDISVEISEDAETSYINLEGTAITISYNGMCNIFKKIKTEEDLEQSERAVLYHEVSHSIMTPQNIYDTKSDSDIFMEALNVFEDERIETLLQSYYYGVDFKRNIIMLNDYQGQEPTTAMEAFYSAVRFRKCEDSINDEINQIIINHNDLTSDINGYYGYNQVHNYREEVRHLWLKICREWFEENDKNSLLKQLPSYDDPETSEGQKNIATQKALEENAGQGDKGEYIVWGIPGEGNEEQENEQQNEINGKEGKDNKDSNASKPGLTQQELEDLIKKIRERSLIDTKCQSKMQEVFQGVIDIPTDKELKIRIKDLFDMFLKRTTNRNMATIKHSGVLNPKLVGREDWKIFEYKGKDGPIHGYDKLHMNLFIDVSGSYCYNENNTNMILKVLDELEREYQFFDFDLVTCQCGEILQDRNHRRIKTGGGNDLDNEVREIYNKIQRKDAFNYNILLLDGYAFTDCRARLEHEKNFSVFNNKNSSIISDKDNKDAIEKYASGAHVIIVNNTRTKSYSEMLYDNIILAMKRAFL